MSSKPCKVLLAGDVGGSLQALFKRVAAVNKSSGPFDLLLCTGSFFPHSGKQSCPTCLQLPMHGSSSEHQPCIVVPNACLAVRRRQHAHCSCVVTGPAACNHFAAGPASDEEVADLELLDYLTGSKQAPVPTYFIGAFGQVCRLRRGWGSRPPMHWCPSSSLSHRCPTALDRHGLMTCRCDFLASSSPGAVVGVLRAYFALLVSEPKGCCSRPGAKPAGLRALLVAAVFDWPLVLRRQALNQVHRAGFTVSPCFSSQACTAHHKP